MDGQTGFRPWLGCTGLMAKNNCQLLEELQRYRANPA